MLLALAIKEILLPALLTFALNPATWGVVLGIVYVALVSKSRYAAAINAAAHTAFHIVEDMKEQGKLPEFLTKEEAALKQFVSILDQQGFKVSDGAVELAKMAWQALNAQQNAKAGAVADATKAAVEAARPT